MDLFTGYICECHTTEIHNNHVFMKLKGGMEGKAMDYRDVDNLFRTLRKKTGIRVTPHVFRHTSSVCFIQQDGRSRGQYKKIFDVI